MRLLVSYMPQVQNSVPDPPGGLLPDSPVAGAPTLSCIEANHESFVPVDTPTAASNDIEFHSL